MPLRVGYVPEHFLTPLMQFHDADQGKTFVPVCCPSGTGQLIKALKEDQIDIAIALTDPLLAGLAKGETCYKLCGSYVSSSLNWAVSTGAKSPYNSIADLKGTPVGISRIGSGSQTMACVMALQQGWVGEDGKITPIEFKVCDDFKGLRDSVNDGSTSCFMWEWFTTKPYRDSGEVRFIGSVPTPWPSWMIASSTDAQRAPAPDVSDFLTKLTGYVKEFDSPEGRKQKDVDYLMKSHGYPEEDIRAWLETVKYVGDCAEIKGEVLINTLDVLEQTGFIQRPAGGFVVESLINEDVARLV
ncbi:hypothetical protein CALCODRAFT_475494 [Calocera cornea HHB12733]|uniref:Ca3427-like PBP 2 domain-containing protein n=1 Tax=Calocera cornea HHB12733 TaxID=1353952 RepID=A0A165DHC3_9BASI|nr:hypothetical protein CALCODRAFT_475494 [Calocera cornea HHB12733]